MLTFSETQVQDLHVVAVHVHRMGRIVVIVDNDTDRIVGSEIVQVPRLVVLVYRAVDGARKQRPAEIRPEVVPSKIVHDVRAVGLCVKNHFLCMRGRICRELERGDGFAESLVSACHRGYDGGWAAVCGARGDLLRVCFLVVDDRECFGLLAVVDGATCDVGAHPVGVGGLSGCFDDYVGSLTDSEGDHFGFVRLFFGCQKGFALHVGLQTGNLTSIGM